MTEEELLEVFRAVAARRMAPGALSPGALLWVEHQVELAAARGADDPRLPDAAAAAGRAEAFFSALFSQAEPRSIFQSVERPAISAETLNEAFLAASRWPFGTRP